MSALREAMSHAVLGWVKPELDETLRLVRQEIESFVEAPADTSRMRFCAGYLHQVQGTLRMVELYAPAMVAEELELLAKALQDGGVGDRDEACATLMRGAVLLPDYLERLQEGHRDIPIVLLPLLNEIRAARGASGLNESMLFPGGASDEATPSEAEIDHARSSLSGRNRELLDTVGNAVKEELLRVKDALDLHLRTGNDAQELEPQVAELGNVADTLGMMGLGVARDVVMQQRDTLRDVVAGSRPADEGTLLDVAGALLYVDASLDDQVARLGSASDAGPDPSAAESQRTVEVLAQEAIINFAGARERFVAFIETNWDHGELADVPRLLDEVAGALRMLELGQAGDYVVGVRRYVSGELIGKKRVPGGQQLDTLADAMASLEYYLEALRERRPNREDILEITRGSLEALRYWPLPPEAAPVVEPAIAAVAAVPATPEPVLEAVVTLVDEPALDEPVFVEAAPVEATTESADASAFGALTLQPIDAAPALADANPFDPVGFEETDAGAEATTMRPPRRRSRSRHRLRLKKRRSTWKKRRCLTCAMKSPPRRLRCRLRRWSAASIATPPISTMRSARSSSRNSTKRSSTSANCCPRGAAIRRTWSACGRSAGCSTRSRAVAAWSAPRRWASSAGRSRTCSTACSIARANPAMPSRRCWSWLATRCRSSTPRCAARAA